MAQGKVGRRENSQGESANLAFSLAEDLLRDLRVYCEAPTDPGDAGKRFEHLLESIDRASEELGSVRHLLAQGVVATPNPKVLEAIAAVEDVVILVHTRTYAQRAVGTEGDLIRLRQALGAARG
jgi:hypothetical protein